MSRSNTHGIAESQSNPIAPPKTPTRSLFPACPELGACLERLFEEQRKIEREQVERLARLREVADRD